MATCLWRTKRDGGVNPVFPPRDEAVVKAIACAAVSQTALPLSRLSLADLAPQASAALGHPISRTTVGRILDADAIKPWRYEYWIFPRDPQFEEKAGRVLDLYAGVWQGKSLGPHDYIISADEKTSIQARIRCHVSLSQRRDARDASSTSTTAAGPYNIWRPGMCNGVLCWVAATPRRVWPPVVGW